MQIFWSVNIENKSNNLANISAKYFIPIFKGDTKKFHFQLKKDGLDAIWSLYTGWAQT